MSPGTEFEARALALVGTRFRPQGRGQNALDCLGLMLAVFRIPAGAARSDYRLRGDHGAELTAGLKPYFRRIAAGAARPGDALLFGISTDQYHFAVKSRRGCIHAHAGIGKVVEMPGMPEWALAGAFRRRAVKRG